jgi:Rieske Fe-S protein
VTADGLSRRSLLTGTGLVVAGGVAGFAVARNSSAARRVRGEAAANAYGSAPARETVLTTTAKVPVGGGVVTHGVVVTRDAGGTVHAFSATCTHQGCTVGAPKGGVIVCPCHGSEFDATTGAVRRGPASRPLPPVPVSVEGDHIVRT